MEEETNMFCAYCNKPWTGKMEVDYTTTSCCYGTCTDTDIFVDIYCEHCDRLLYRKEIHE